MLELTLRTTFTREAAMKLRRAALRIAGALVLLLIALTIALWLKPPDILRVGANYSAKIVCSNVFLAGRDPDEVLRTDVQAPGIALLRLMRVSVDRERRVVRAGLLGFIGDGLAVARPRTGCAVIPDGNLDLATHAGAPPGEFLAAPGITSPSPRATPGADARALWPDGNAIAADPALDRLLADDALAGSGVRAIVVVSHGRIVAERYAPGFSASTPLLGWSMTKTVLAGLVGILVSDGRLTLDQTAGWSETGGGGRERIRIADLLAMSSGLRFNEAYGTVSDVTRMLFLEPDTAGFAREQPLAHPVGEVWSYSSGTANILSRIVQDAAAPLGAAYPTEKLFTPLGMSSATIEADEHGTLVGSSYMYATARDWARYAQFLAQDGIWRGQALLPPGFVAMMATPVKPSGGEYGHGMVWLWASDAIVPGKNPDSAYGIPADTFWMEGHDGQITAIIRSRDLVVVRLGLTPVSAHYLPQPLVKALLEAAK
jgi:CubicO group peptidase (beta-lactamase class C family)